MSNGWKRGAWLAMSSAVLLACGGSDSKPTTIYLFVGPTHHCDLGGRAGADALAASGLPASLKGKTVHAFISVSAEDDLAGMPAKFGFPADIPVKSPDGTVVLADSWAGLLGGDAPAGMPLSDTIGAPVGGSWWSGSNLDGTVSDHTCSGWTDVNGTGEIGITSGGGESWITSGGVGVPGGNDYLVLGIAY